MLTAVIGVVPDVESLLERVETTLGSHYIAIYTANAFSTVSIYKEYKKVLFHLARSTVPLRCFPQAMPTLLFFVII